MLTTEEKKKLIEKHKINEKDSGSPEVQISLLTEEIEKLVQHLEKHPKDFHSKRGLLKMVSVRKNLLNYLAKKDKKRHESLIKKLGLKK